MGEVDWSRYDRTTALYHRRQILRQFGVASFEDAQAMLLEQVTHFARHQMNPVAVFRSAAEYLRSHRLEVPTYATLAGVVTLAFRHVEQRLTTQLPHVLPPSLRKQLDALFLTDDQAPASRHHPYRLTALKRSLEVMRPAAIRANVQDYGYLKRLYHQVAPVAEALGLSDELVRYYARYVERAQFFQVQQQADKKYVMVICFILHQYYQLGDVLTETLLQAVQTHRNAARRDKQERVYRQQQETAGLLAQVLDGVEQHGAALVQLEQTVLSFGHTHEEKINALVAWLHTPAVAGFGHVHRAARQLRQRADGPQGPYYRVVEERSRALQQRLGDILRHVDYEGSPDNGVSQALTYFQTRAGQLGSQPPLSFLKAVERAALDQAESRTSLYKALLAGHVADHVKAGKLNLPHSFSYRAFESYLLDVGRWRQERETLLQQTNLSHLAEPSPWLDELQQQLNQSFAHTFGRLNEGANPAVRRRADGKPRFLTPAHAPLPAEQVLPPRTLYPSSRIVSLYEVLHTVNQQCRFVDRLEHWNPRYRQELPAERVFFAGLMAYGCNLGLSHMAHAAKQVPLATLENTVNWHFSVEHLRRANDAVVALIGKLPVSRLFQQRSAAVHTG